MTIKHGGHPDQLSLRFRAMDFLRVKALVPFLTDANDALTPDEKHHVACTIVVKCDILLRGYEKYNQPQDRAQVLDWRGRADIVRNTFASTHSATERLPRSLESATL